jgi:hypothetical protein
MNSLYRKCNGCGNTYPVTSEFFTKNSSVKSGFYSLCKQCKADRDLQYRIQNKDKKRVTDKAYREKNKETVSERQKAYYYENHEAEKLKRKNYYYANKEKMIEQHKEYVSQNINVVRKYKKKWRKNNPEKLAIIAHNRRSQKKSLEYSLTPEQWKHCLEFFNYRDAYTGLPMSTISQDHIVPLAKGGTYTSDNIVPCEINVNCSKQDSDMESWFRKQPYFSEHRLKRIYEWIRKNKLSIAIGG